ncbi:MAG: hypothetical protein J6X18_13770 [Bacteroidales bacterium]|nr:hypothetical protein [Bacteroidales bacterium]
MKKIHITEAQLNYIKSKLTEAVAVDATKEVEAKGGNVNAAWQDMKSKNPSLSQQADDGEVSISVNPKGIDEGLYEFNKQDSDSEDYQEVYNYLTDLRGTPDYYSIMRGMWGNQGEVNEVIDKLFEYFGGRISKDYIMSAVYDFRNEESEYMENMGNVDESRKFTKRQIKEAKIRKLRKSCERFTKKDLK